MLTPKMRKFSMFSNSLSDDDLSFGTNWIQFKMVASKIICSMNLWEDNIHFKWGLYADPLEKVLEGFFKILEQTPRTLDKESENLFYEVIDKVCTLSPFKYSHVELIFRYIMKHSDLHRPVLAPGLPKVLHSIIPLTINRLLKNLFTKHYSKFESGMPTNYFCFNQGPDNFIDIINSNSGFGMPTIERIQYSTTNILNE
jgi:hypothetical protein